MKNVRAAASRTFDGEFLSSLPKLFLLCFWKMGNHLRHLLFRTAAGIKEHGFMGTLEVALEERTAGLMLRILRFDTCGNVCRVMDGVRCLNLALGQKRVEFFEKGLLTQICHFLPVGLGHAQGEEAFGRGESKACRKLLGFLEILLDNLMDLRVTGDQHRLTNGCVGFDALHGNRAHDIMTCGLGKGCGATAETAVCFNAAKQAIGLEGKADSLFSGVTCHL